MSIPTLKRALTATASSIALGGATFYAIRRLTANSAECSASQRNPKLQIVYFPVQARAEVPRMILEFGGIDYVDESCSSYFGKSWPEVKAETPFGQVRWGDT